MRYPVVGDDSALREPSSEGRSMARTDKKHKPRIKSKGTARKARVQLMATGKKGSMRKKPMTVREFQGELRRIRDSLTYMQRQLAKVEDSVVIGPPRDGPDPGGGPHVIEDLCGPRDVQEGKNVLKAIVFKKSLERVGTTINALISLVRGADPKMRIGG